MSGSALEPGVDVGSGACGPIADVPLAEVTRGDLVECVHRGAVAIAWADGRTWSVGDAGRPVWMRSAIKSLQALPLLERGVADRVGLDDSDLAVVVASHDGTEEHTAAVDRVLHKGGLRRNDLLCGPHAPLDKRASVALARSGGKPQRIHNNCSGKHTGFLLLAQDLGVPLATHLDPEGAVQRLVRATVADVCGLDPNRLPVAVDGCGAPTFAIPLTALARGFTRLLNPADLTDVRRASCERLLHAIASKPVLAGGRGRLTTALLESAPERVWPKNGAEGVYIAGAIGADGPCAVAIKIRDGHERATFPVVVSVLHRLGLWPRVPDALRAFAEPPVLNTQKRTVGAVRLTLELPETWSSA